MDLVKGLCIAINQVIRSFTQNLLLLPERQTMVIVPPSMDASKSPSNKTDKNRHVCDGLQLSAVDLTICNNLKFPCLSATVLTVFNCIDCLQLS